MASLDLPGAEISVQGFADSRFGSRAVAGLRIAFERSPHGMLLADDLRRLVSGNPAACDRLGIAPGEVCWLTMDVFTPPSERRTLEQQWKAFLTSGAAEGRYRLAVPNGEPLSVEFSATANVLPGRHLLVFVSQADKGQGAWAPVAAEGADPQALTKREREVVTLVAAGLQSGDIAERLFLSPETVKSHVHNAMAKLGSRTRAHAVAMALVTGQISWETERGSSA